MRRWLGLFGILAVAGVLAVVLSRHLASQEQRFETIKEGMTREQVIEIMGPPMPLIPGVDDDYVRHHLLWQDKDDHLACYFVILDDDGRVQLKNWSAAVGRKR